MPYQKDLTLDVKPGMRNIPEPPSYANHRSLLTGEEVRKLRKDALNPKASP